MNCKIKKKQKFKIYNGSAFAKTIINLRGKVSQDSLAGESGLLCPKLSRIL